ncbi:MAG: hypothetical protein ACRC9R_07880 [Enterovibrio sp.]
MRPSLYQQICVLWDHLQLNQTLESSDCIVLFSDSDFRVIEHAAALYNAQLALRIVIVQNAENPPHSESEPLEIQEILADLGVELSAIFTLSQAHFDLEHLAHKLSNLQKLLIVTAPYMQKNLAAQLASSFSGVKLIFSSPALEPIDYASHELPLITLVQKTVENAARHSWKNSAFNAAERHALQAFQQLKALLA